MADPVSLTAAAGGFIGLAGQLAQGVIKVKEIYTTINDAPRDIANLCSKMAALQGVLEEVGDQIQTLCQSNVDLDTRILRDVITQCENSRYKVEVHVKKFSDGFRHSRGAAVRYVFKKKEMQEMLSDLEQCKSSLILARQSIDGEAVSTQQRLDFDTISQQVARSSERSIHGYQSLRDAHHESSTKISESLRDLKNQLHSQHDDGSAKVMLARIGDIQRDIQVSNRHLEQLVSRRSEDFHLNSARTTKRVKVGFQSMLFNFSVEFSSEAESQDAKGNTVAKDITKRVCTIRLPKWFVQDQYNLAIARSKNGWLFHPSVYRTIGYDSPFFRACSQGKIEEIKMLLTTKQAYLGDRNPGADTALSEAFFAYDLEVCRLLISAGILCTFQSSDYFELLEQVVYRVQASNDDRSKSRELLCLLEQEQNLGADWLDDLQLDSGSCKVILDLRSYAEETGDSDLDCFEALMFPTTMGCFDPGLSLYAISEFLRDTDHVQAIRSAAVESAWLLWAVAQRLCKLFTYHVDEDHPCEEAIRAGCFALTVMCDSGLDLHTPCNSLPGVWKEWSLPRGLKALGSYNCTPFAFVIVEMLPSYSGVHHEHWICSQVINLWATTLHSAGVDLAAYAAQEIRIINRILTWVRAEHHITYRFSYGPEPSDWKLELGPPGEAHPANFWRGIEAVPIEEDLAGRVLAVVFRVEHPFDEHCEAPGGWQTHRYALEQPSWDVTGWLAFMDDDGLAEVEADLERLGAEEFYEIWDLSSVIEEWPCIEVWDH